MKTKVEKRISTLRRVLTYVRPYRFKVFLAMLCTVLCVAGELIIPVFCGDAIDQMIGQGKVLFDGVLHYIIYIMAATVIMALSHTFMEILNHEVICLVARDLREQATAKTHRLPLSYLDTHPTGDVVSRIINDVDVFAEGLLAGLYELPNVQGHLDEDQVLTHIRALGFEPLRIKRLDDAKHIFTHIEWQMIAYAVQITPEFDGYHGASDTLIVQNDDLHSNYAIPSAFSAYVKYL